MAAASALPPFWKSAVREWLQADAPTFDIGGAVVGDTLAEAALLCKTDTVLAGVPFFDAVFSELACTVEWHAREGDSIISPFRAATVRGPCRMLLLGERTALNILSRASGICATARALVVLSRSSGWAGEVAGTRKVTPGFRLVEKYALMVAGASTHRMDLSHMVMLKDNHVWAAGSITAAVTSAKRLAGFSSKIEVEARGLTEAKEAAAAGADIVMLDNYLSPAELSADALKLKAEYPHVLVEASGGITASTLPSYCVPGNGVDVVSMGSLTHGYGVADFSLKVAVGEGKDRIERTLSKEAAKAEHRF